MGDVDVEVSVRLCRFLARISQQFNFTVDELIRDQVRSDGLRHSREVFGRRCVLVHFSESGGLRMQGNVDTVLRICFDYIIDLSAKYLLATFQPCLSCPPQPSIIIYFIRALKHLIPLGYHPATPASNASHPAPSSTPDAQRPLAHSTALL